VPTAEIVLAVIHRSGRVLLEKRPPEGLLAGMWAFPERRLGPVSPAGDASAGGVDDPAAGEAAAQVAESLGLPIVGDVRALEPCRHRFTHLEAVYFPWVMEVAPGDATGDREMAWVDPAFPGQRALPRAQQRVLEAWTRTIGRETE
jgi:adenine-specific DNA glycosylase